MNLRHIILSRLNKKPKSWIEDRREHCRVCPHNTKNGAKETIKIKVYRIISNILSFLMRAENKELGSCKICTCPIYYKTKVEEEECSLDFIDEKPKWISIINTKYKEKYERN